MHRKISSYFSFQICTYFRMFSSFSMQSVNIFQFIKYWRFQTSLKLEISPKLLHLPDLFCKWLFWIYVQYNIQTSTQAKSPQTLAFSRTFLSLCPKLYLRYYVVLKQRETENKVFAINVLPWFILAPVFPCPLCVGFFFTLAAMKNHLEAEHRKYQCDICRKLMSHKRNVDRHR